MIDTRLHRKKAMLTKMNRTLLKLTALCMLDSVGAASLPLSPAPCLDENKPNDPEYCQNAVGSFIDKITKCKQDSFIISCERTCGFCPPLPLVTTSPPLPPSPPPPSPISPISPAVTALPTPYLFTPYLFTP